MNKSLLSAGAARNRELWDQQAAEYQAKHGGQLTASGGAAWGVWQMPESQLQILGDVSGRDVLELGCGAAQWSIALHRLGARVTALDNSAGQLSHARVLMAAAAIEFPLVHSSAESTGLADESFDIIFCDHGAMTFGDPYQTIPEAARLLRVGGLLAFSMYTPIMDMVYPPGSAHPSDALSRNYWNLHALEEPGEPVAFQLPYGTWIRLFLEHTLAIEGLIELCPHAEATSSYCNDRDREWARCWPMEHIWRVRKRSSLQRAQ
jgi:SAM-dependent methyltransferase